MFNSRKYLAQAEDRFGFDGDDMLGFDASEIDMDADGGDAGVAAQTPLPYSLVIQNTAGANATAVLFGRNVYLVGSTNYGSDASIVITPSYTNISYVEVLQQSGEQPFDTSLVRIQSSNSSQVTQVITVTSKDANGQQFTSPITTQNYFSAMQFQSGIVDVPYRMTINANTYLSFTVLASTTVTMTFFPAEKTSISRVLGGKNALKKYGSPQVPIVAPVNMVARKPLSYPAGLVSNKNA